MDLVGVLRWPERRKLLPKPIETGEGLRALRELGSEAYHRTEGRRYGDCSKKANQWWMGKFLHVNT